MSTSICNELATLTADLDIVVYKDVYINAPYALIGNTVRQIDVHCDVSKQYDSRKQFRQKSTKIKNNLLRHKHK